MQSESITRFERPIERRPLHEEVADRLRELVTEGVLPPGHHLNERVLCAQLGVSRTPLREAFKVLAAERLIELHPNRGASVAALSARDVAQLFEVMSALEACRASSRRSAAPTPRSPRRARSTTRCSPRMRGVTCPRTTGSTGPSTT